MAKLERSLHQDKDRNGLFRKSPPCDGCNKPVGTNYSTDEDVCGSTDGPGFFLCERKRCTEQRNKLNVEEREALYAANREARK